MYESNDGPYSKAHRANMVPIWGRQGPGGPHVGPMNFAIWGDKTQGFSLPAVCAMSIAIVYSTVYSGWDQRKYQSSVSLAFVRGIHRSPVNSPHKGPVTRKMFSFDDVIIDIYNLHFLIKPTSVQLWWHMVRHNKFRNILAKLMHVLYCVRIYSALSIYHGYFSLYNSWKAPHSSPVRARYAVSFASANLTELL